MKCYLSSFALFTGMLIICAQTPIVLEAGPISYTNLDGFVDDSYSINVENCSSISYMVDYNFSMPWIGFNNMDHNAECIAPDCLGDPTDPQSQGCTDCWDFMWIESELDGTTLDDDIVGVASNLNQNGTYTFGPICTDGATNAGISIRNQNNTNDETNTFENVTIICWEGVPEFNTNDPICDGEDLFLTGNSVNNSDVAMWEWSNTGTGMITDINNPVTSATNPQDGETYTLTASDLNSCTADDSQTVSVFSAFTAELSGGGTICLNNCTDSSEDVVISLNGGSGSYTLSLTLNGGSIPFPFAIPINDFDESFTICATNDILPSIDQSIDPPIISIPSFLLPVTFGIDNISDGTCNGMVIGNDVTIDVAPQPNIVDPVSLEYCVRSSCSGTDISSH
jgi:hypothetical protein